jgi:hypothetical protein
MEEKLIFSGGFETPPPVEEENASVRFISLGSACLWHCHRCGEYGRRDGGAGCGHA